MVVQTEDCIDCLKTIHDGEYQYAFLYDHISGHAKKRAGGLDVSNMKKNWGGQLLRRTLIKEKVGCLGPFHDLANPKMVQVGEEQSLWYETPRDLEHGPFHLSSTEREDKRYDAQIPLPSDKVGSRDKLKGGLTEELMETEYGRVEGRNVMSKKLLM